MKKNISSISKITLLIIIILLSLHITIQLLQKDQSTLILNKTNTTYTINLISPYNKETFGNNSIDVIFETNTTINNKYILDDGAKYELENNSILNLSEGTHTLQLIGFDTDNNSYFSERVEFTVDLSPPKVILSHPKADAFLFKRNITFKFEAEDISGVDNCTLLLTNLNLNYSTANNQLILYNLPNGKNQWQVLCRDTAGYSQITDPQTFFIIENHNYDIIYSEEDHLITVKHPKIGKVNITSFINLSNLDDIEEIVKIQSNNISILKEVNATVYFYDISISNPQVKKNSYNCHQCKFIGHIDSNYVFNTSSAGSYAIVEKFVVSGQNNTVINKTNQSLTKAGNYLGTIKTEQFPHGADSSSSNYSEFNTTSSRTSTSFRMVRTYRESSPMQIDRYIEQNSFKPIISCVNSDSKETITSVDISDDVELPQGYEILMDPMKLGCSNPFNFVLQVPDYYKDLSIMKCFNGKCTLSSSERVATTECGQLLLEASRETVAAESLNLEKIFLEKTFKSNDRELILEKSGYKLKIIRTAYGNVKARMNSLDHSIDEAKNIGLKIASIPLSVQVQGNDIQKVQLEIPYSSLPHVDPDGYAVYQFREDSYQYLGGEIENNKISISIQDYDEEMILVVMGVFCTTCSSTSLDLVYEPSTDSKSAVVLVHGLASSPATYHELIGDIKQTQQPFALFTFGYPSSKEISEISNEFADLLDSRLAHYENIVIVSHSLGGIVTQQAIYAANNRGLGIVQKVKKVILIATPNLGSIAANAHERLHDVMINSFGGFGGLFNINSKLMPVLINGKTTPRVPGIDYFVVAGTKPIQGIFGALDEVMIDEKHDGLVTVKSAQYIGDDYVDDLCKDYWDVYSTHQGIIHEIWVRQIVGRIIRSAVDPKLKNKVSLGNSKYFKFDIESCDDSTYYLIGQKITNLNEISLTGCSCGDNICTFDEKFICPSDCGIVDTASSNVRHFVNSFRYFRPYLIILAIIFIIFTIVFLIRQQIKQGKTDSNLENILLKTTAFDLMSIELIKISPDSKISEAMKKMIHTAHNTLVVAEKENILGLISEKDIFMKASHSHNVKKVKDIMRKYEKLDTDPPVREVGDFMSKSKIRKILVFDQNRLTGIITPHDVINHLMDKDIHLNFTGQVPLVSAVMKRNIVQTTKNNTLKEALEQMQNSNVSSIIIVEKSEPIGIFTSNDFIRLLISSKKSILNSKMEKLMSQPVFSIKSTENVIEAAVYMRLKKCRRLPVINQGILCGIISQSDILKALMPHIHSSSSHIKKKQ